MSAGATDSQSAADADGASEHEPPNSRAPAAPTRAGAALLPFSHAPWRTNDAYRPLLLDADEQDEPEDAGGAAAADACVPHETLWSCLHALLLPLYAPMLLLFFAWGLVTPILPLFATSLGASTAGVGVVSSARAFGSLLATLPSGVVVQRGGVRAATLSGATGYFLACGWGGAATGVPSLALSRVLAGAGYSLFSLAQQTYVRQRVPAHFRGRVLASVGGAYRVGGLLAPLAGGLLAQHVNFRAVFALQAAVSAAALPFIALRMRSSPAQATSQAASSDAAAGGDSPSPPMSLRSFLRENWRSVGAAWTATLLMSIVRSVRDLLIPLAAAAAGFSRASTGYVTAASYAGDTLLFPLGGYLMDAYGCWLAGAAASGIMALGLLPLALPASTGAHATAMVCIAAVATGTGNGLSSGIVMALASNQAPSDDRAGPFIASYNFVAAVGGVLGPIIVGELAQVAGLRAGAAAAAATAVLGCAWWGLALPHPPRQSKAAKVGVTAEGVPEEEELALVHCVNDDARAESPRAATQQ